jgi:hypothetical protein
MPKSGAKVYVVQRIDWRYRDRSLPYERPETPGSGTPVKAFTDRKAADDHCRELERSARGDRDVCPFEYGRSYPSLDDVTTRPADEVIDWLSEQGLNPPAGQKEVWQADRKLGRRAVRPNSDSYREWVMWWGENAGGWTKAQFEAV